MTAIDIDRHDLRESDRSWYVHEARAWLCWTLRERGVSARRIADLIDREPRAVYQACHFVDKYFRWKDGRAQRTRAALGHLTGYAYQDPYYTDA